MIVEKIKLGETVCTSEDDVADRFRTFHANEFLVEAVVKEFQIVGVESHLVKDGGIDNG
jgi:hypothetical protein